jgi:sigma-B regulation protein RsbU (phosphoserine phosphatase)
MQTLSMAGEPLARGQSRPKGGPALTRRDMELEFWRTGKIAARPPKPTAAPRLDPSRLGIVIADVTDKGVPAALFMVLSRTVIRATASDGRAPAVVLEQANRLILSEAKSGLFVTCFYSVLDFESGELTYASGGHNYPLVYRTATGSVEQLNAQGIVLGIVPEPRFEQRTIQLDPGDVVCFYTDGVTEAMDARRQLFDEERLIEVLRRSHQLEPEEIITRIIDAVTNFSAGTPQADDITLVVLKRDAV